MHFFAPDKNYWGGHGIVAGQTPLGLGLAYGLKYNGDKGAALCFMGDGAVNQGSFHESLNLAQLMELPVIYIIENNGFHHPHDPVPLPPDDHGHGWLQLQRSNGLQPVCLQGS